MKRLGSHFIVVFLGEVGRHSERAQLSQSFRARGCIVLVQHPRTEQLSCIRYVLESVKTNIQKKTGIETQAGAIA